MDFITPRLHQVAVPQPCALPQHGPAPLAPGRGARSLLWRRVARAGARGRALVRRQMLANHPIRSPSEGPTEGRSSPAALSPATGGDPSGNRSSTAAPSSSTSAGTKKRTREGDLQERGRRSPMASCGWRKAEDAMRNWMR